MTSGSGETDGQASVIPDVIMGTVIGRLRLVGGLAVFCGVSTHQICQKTGNS